MLQKIKPQKNIPIRKKNRVACSVLMIVTKKTSSEAAEGNIAKFQGHQSTFRDKETQTQQVKILVVQQKI